MSRGQFNFGGKQFPRLKIPPVLVAAVFCLGIIGLFVLFWAVKSMVNVDQGEIAVFIKKTGDLPPANSIVAPGIEYKGIMAEQQYIKGEGWHFMNNFVWERVKEFTETIMVEPGSENLFPGGYVPEEGSGKVLLDVPVYRKVKVPEGKSRIRVRLSGEPLNVLAGNVVVKEGSTAKGMLSGKELLRPGTYTINRLNYYVGPEEEPVRIQSGYKGVVLLKAGNILKDPNVFIVESGSRGVQKETLDPIVKFINRYEEEIFPIDLRSQIYHIRESETKGTHSKNEMMGEPITFPSKDGFDIKLEGKIEWKIDPERAAEVFVKYVDNRPVMECLVEKIILPQARSFVRIYGSMEEARGFIEGTTRQNFQEKLFKDLKKHCFTQGIVIVNVSITEMLPPKEIARLINDREVAKRMKAKYLKEKDKEIQEKQLAMEKKLQDRSRKVNEEQARVSVMKTKAEEDKQVAIVEARKKLSVAKLELEASRKLANAIMSKGQAKADVIGYNNTAVSAGIKKAAEAFRSGEGYARYLFLQKVAPGFMYILANTDGPFIKVFEELFGKGDE